MSTTHHPEGISFINLNAFSRTDMTLKCLSVSTDFSEGTTENITAIFLPATAVVQNVYLNVSVAEATGVTKTINVGTDSTSSGDADGYMVAVDVSSTGLKKATLVDGGVTMGALLFVESGTGVDVANAPEPDVASGGKAISWTPGSADWAEFKGEILVFFWEVADIRR